MNHKAEIGDFFIPKVGGLLHFIVLGFTKDNRTVELQFEPEDNSMFLAKLLQGIPVYDFDKI